MLDEAIIQNPDLKLVSDQIKFSFGLNEMKEFKLNQDDLVTIFIKSIMKLKTDLNYKYVKKACEAENIKFEDNMVKPGKYEGHAFFYTAALLSFINYYTKNNDKSIQIFVDANLLKHKDELFFNEFKVDVDTQEFNQAEAILDALCVKFYQVLTLILDQYFSINHKVMVITPEPENNKYVFTVRNMNIMEIDNVRNGKATINAKE